MGDELKTTPDGTFILINPRSNSLRKLLCERNVNIPKPLPRVVLYSSAYADIRNSRTAATRAIVDPPDDDDCTLFAAASTATPKKGKIRKLSLPEERTTSITFDVESRGEVLFKLTTLYPMNSNSTLWVLEDVDMVENMIEHLRSGTYDSDGGLYSKRDNTIPKGIWRKRGGYYVFRGKKQHFSAELDDAKANLAQQGETDNEDGADGDDDDEDENEGKDEHEDDGNADVHFE